MMREAMNQIIADNTHLKDNEIPDYMFRNILRQYAGKEDAKHFSCCQSKTGRKVKSCTEPTE